MAYKFHAGTYNTSGALNVESAITGNALLVDTGGITVSAGASSVQQLTASALKVDNTILDGDILSGLSQVTASAISASSAQFGTVTVTTLSAPNLDLSGYLVVSGNTTLGDASSDVVTVKGQLTASAGISSSFGIQVGGGGTFAGNLVVNGATTTVQTLTASQGLSASIGIQAGGNSTVNALNVNGAFNTFGTAVMQGVTVKAGDLVVQDGSSNEKVRISNAAGNISGSGTLQVGGAGTIGGLVTANAGIKNYGTDLRSINQKIVVRDGGDANDKALMDGTGQISGSGNLNIGGAGVVAGNFTVNGAQTTVQQLTASFSTLGAAKVTSLSSSGNVIVAGDLQVNGTTTYVNSTNLTVTDKKVVIATGSANAAAADGAGLYVGADDGGAGQYAAIAYDGTGDLWNLTSVNGLDLATAGQVIKFEGTDILKKTQLFGGAVTGSSAGVGLKLDVLTVSSSPVTIAFNNYVIAVNTSAARTINLPAAGAGDAGRVFLVKDVTGQAATNNVTITPNGSDTLDGVNASIKLESPYAAVSIVCVGANAWALF